MYESVNLKNESFVTTSSITFFFIYPKDLIQIMARENTDLRDSNDPDGNYQRFNLSTKVLNKKRALKAKRHKRFLEKYYIKTKNTCNNLNKGNGSKIATSLPNLRTHLTKKIK